METWRCLLNIRKRSPKGWCTKYTVMVHNNEPSSMNDFITVRTEPKHIRRSYTPLPLSHEYFDDGLCTVVKNTIKHVLQRSWWWFCESQDSVCWFYSLLSNVGMPKSKDLSVSPDRSSPMRWSGLQFDYNNGIIKFMTVTAMHCDERNAI